MLLIPFTLNYRRLDKTGKWLYYYLISSIVFAAGSKLIGTIWKNNMWFFSVMYYLQYIILSFFFLSIIKNNIVKWCIKLLPIPVLAVFILDFVRLEGPYAYNSISASTKTFALIVFGLAYFLQLLYDEDLVKRSIFINTLPDFWYNSGLFIYHCSFFLFSLTYNFILRADLMFSVPLAITYVAGMIQLILFYIGLRKVKKMRP